jgi:hypothetical protein
MLQLRKEQMEAFYSATGGHFEDELVAHLYRFTPHQASALGDDGLMRVVDYGLERADNHGFTLRGPARCYLETMFLLGSDFDTDPQYPWAFAILSDPEHPDQVERADALHASVGAYLAAAAPPEARDRAMHAALGLLDAEPPPWDERFEAIMLATARRSWPEKYAAVGETALRTLVEDSEQRAEHFDIFDGDGASLMFALAYALGNGCAFDPQYPWIQSSLALPEPGERRRRLRSRAKTYLSQAMTNLSGESSHVRR